MKKQHFTIKTDATSAVQLICNQLMGNTPVPEFSSLHGKEGAIFSQGILDRYIEKEARHEIKILGSGTQQSLVSMSSGEQKKALLQYVLKLQPHFLILVNPYDNLDASTVTWLKERLLELSNRISLIEFLSRIEDKLPLTSSCFYLKIKTLVAIKTEKAFRTPNKAVNGVFEATIPEPLHPIATPSSILVEFKNVSVSFYGKQVLQHINWTIKKGEFWQLIGPNGSGKSTLLSMITGDSHKGYGQDLTLFGRKKGSGESVWDIKKNIGYFTPPMTARFKKHHTLAHMIVSGLHDSVGLYVKPTETELKLAQEWLGLLGLSKKGETSFREISEGEKRLLMTARAMIKHPPLLILDEPTVGLDDTHARSFVQLVNKMAQETHTAIIYVSHREEEGLHPNFSYHLSMTAKGSIGKISYI